MITRRNLLNALGAAGLTACAPGSQIRRWPVPYRRIATEEAWLSRDILAAYGRLLDAGAPGEPGFRAMGGFLFTRGTDSPLIDSLLDLDDGRIRRMDSLGIDVQLLMLTAPGVQVFDAAEAAALAAASNDEVADAVRRRPGRFAALAAVAPQDPAGAARELERAVASLGLNGVVINSHTRGEYLDDPSYWEIFEAAEANDAPIYIHPRTPAPSMLEPYVSRGLDQAILGFGAEVALHVVALITAGVFDEFPRLKVVIGHAGEGLPYWLYRIDTMQVRVREPGGARRLDRLPSDYFRSNIYITSSGVAWEPAILFAQEVLGPRQVMYAMDYPYQASHAEVEASDAFDMSAADKLAFFEGNARRVFGIA